MPSQWFLYSYLLAAVAALSVLVVFRAQRWYLHAISVLAGLLAGIMPPFGGAGGDWFYLVAGVACVFLMTWGVGGLFFARRRRVVSPAQSASRSAKGERPALA